MPPPTRKIVEVAVVILLPVLAGMAVRALAPAISMEIGIHNGTLAMYVALSVLENTAIAVPPAIYSVLMFFTAAAFAGWATRGARRQPDGIA